MSKLLMLLSHECDNCGSLEERVFTDSWTGVELCLPCLVEVAGQVTISPGTGKDNLQKLLDETDGMPDSSAWINQEGGEAWD